MNPREYIINLSAVDQAGKKTLMIRNIPNRYDQKMLIRTIDQTFKGTYDFFYLPIDFKANSSIFNHNLFRTSVMLDTLLSISRTHNS